MSQFQDDLNASQSIITEIFSSKIASKFQDIANERQYTNGQQIIDDTENIIDRLQINEQSQHKIFNRLIVEIFQHHNNNIESLKLLFCYISFCLCSRINACIIKCKLNIT